MLSSTRRLPSRWTPQVHALAGIDYSLTPRFALTTQGKYEWGKATMSNDFQQFDKIRQMMKEEGFKPTTQPATTRPTTKQSEDL